MVTAQTRRAADERRFDCGVVIFAIGKSQCALRKRTTSWVRARRSNSDYVGSIMARRDIPSGRSSGYYTMVNMYSPTRAGGHDRIERGGRLEVGHRGIRSPRRASTRYGLRSTSLIWPD